MTEKNGEKWFYHHFDGYPEGVGEKLKSILSNAKDWNINTLSELLLKTPQFEETDGQHGDEEYAYLIDCDKMTLTCFKGGWDEWDWRNTVLKE